MPFNIGPLELIIVLVIVLLVIGPRHLPEIGSALGRTFREFRKGVSDTPEDGAASKSSTPGDAPRS